MSTFLGIIALIAIIVIFIYFGKYIFQTIGYAILGTIVGLITWGSTGSSTFLGIHILIYGSIAGGIIGLLISYRSFRRNMDNVCCKCGSSNTHVKKILQEDGSLDVTTTCNKCEHVREKHYN